MTVATDVCLDRRRPFKDSRSKSWAKACACEWLSLYTQLVLPKTGSYVALEPVV